MKSKLILSHLAGGFLSAAAAFAQGTFIYDQQSFTAPIARNGLYALQTGTGQSFLPDLSSVGFVQLELNDGVYGNGLGATVAVLLHGGAIDGPVLGSSDPVSMLDGFFGVATFLFSNPISVAPNTSYFFEPVVQSGDAWYVNTATGLNYPNGTMYIQGTPRQFAYFWFREGIIVPEPQVSSLLLVGSGVLAFLRPARALKRRSGNTTRTGDGCGARIG